MSDSKVTSYTCLWFDGRVSEAAEFYTQLIPGSRILRTVKYPAGNDFPGGHGADDTLTVDLEIAGSPFQLLNGGPHFPQTEAASIAVNVDGQAEVDRIWNALIAHGGQESQCGWCKDRFGVSWQVVPTQLAELMSGPRAGAVAQALNSMQKIDLSVLEAAARSAG